MRWLSFQWFCVSVKRVVRRKHCGTPLSRAFNWFCDVLRRVSTLHPVKPFGTMLPVLLTAAILVASNHGAAEWVEFDNCRLAPNESNDGDSFHVMHKGREYVFRLYFVDSPETSELIPSRVQEQAKAFETTKDKVLEAGKKAGDYTKKALRRDFRVTTRWEDARGMSDLGRHYAFVETADGKDLGELLVGAGWARSYGMKAATRSRPAAQWQQRYDRLEKKARRAGTGIWGDGKGGAVALESEEAASESGADEADEGLTGGLMDAALSTTSLSPASRSGAAKPLPSPRRVAAEVSPTPTRPATTVASGKTKLDINKATKDELMALPGIDEAKADAIIAARPFAGSYDLLRVPGVGPATLKEIYPYIEE